MVESVLPGTAPLDGGFVIDTGSLTGRLHALQLYDDDDFLVEAVWRFVWSGLQNDEHVVVVCSRGHKATFEQRLWPRVPRAGEARCIILDAEETLARFMVGDMPDAVRFRTFVDALITDAHAQSARGQLRVYGEMVNLLWQSGRGGAALRLEELWQQAVAARGFTLLCGYVMGNFYRESHSQEFEHICHHHTHVMPTEAFALARDGDAARREIARLEQRARSLETELEDRRTLERRMRSASREARRLTEAARRGAGRDHPRAAEVKAFAEMLLVVLERDLPAPLHAVLTAAGLMRRDATANEARLDRIMSGVERALRMIAQLLDRTRAHLGMDADVSAPSSTPIDLASLVRGVVEKSRVAHPTRLIDVVSSPCVVGGNPDVLAQVIDTLLGNAVAHGDPSQPIRVTVAAEGRQRRVAVHNDGAPIDRANLPFLFDPEARGGRIGRGSDGLGLGLFVAQRAVAAHGGHLDVRSSKEAGTTFTMVLPAEAGL